MQKRHGHLKTPSSLPSATTGIDVLQAPQGAAMVVNNTSTPPNAATFIFYDANKTALTAPTTIFYNGQFVVVPAAAAFVSVTYVSSNENNDEITVLDMQPIDSKPGTAYSLTNPASIQQPADSPEPWSLQTSLPLPVPVGQPSSEILQNPIYTFMPAQQLSAPGLIGQATLDGTATISDPSGLGSQKYSFKNVVMIDPITTSSIPKNLTFIGSWMNTGMCPQAGCAGSRMLNFYGQLNA